MKLNDAETFINVIWADGSVKQLQSVICDDEEEKTHVISVPSVFAEQGIVHFYRCKNGSLCAEFVDGFIDYDDNSFLETPLWTKHYFQVGAGIGFMAAYLTYSGIIKNHTLLEVGCGFGFTLDYWNWASDSDQNSFGYEPSAYGRLGKEILGVNIKNCYLAEDQEISTKKFDRIFSSEVIEHVDDPMAFVQELKEKLKDDGILILTTPSAEYITPQNPLTILLAALSPGLHRFLFSQKALGDLLYKAGFTHVDVKIVNERLISYASCAPFKIQEDPHSAYLSYLDYLSDRAWKNYRTDMKLGFLFRLFKELVNLGRKEDLQKIIDEIASLVEKEYNFNIYDLEKQLYLSKNIKDFLEYGEKFPYFISVLLYYIGMAKRQKWIEGEESAPFFIASAHITLDGYVLSPNNFQEAASLYWRAIFEAGCALLAQGKRKEALIYFDKIIKQDEWSQYEKSLECSPELLLLSKREKTHCLLQSGYPEMAMAMLREMIHKSSDDRQKRQLIRTYKIAKKQALKEMSSFLSLKFIINYRINKILRKIGLRCRLK